MSNPRPKRLGDSHASIDSFDDSLKEKWVADEFPCVCYEADELLNILRVSENVHDLIGIKREQLIGVSWFSQEAVVPADRALVKLKLAELNCSRETSLIHRMVDDRGRLVKVAHSLRRVIIGGQPTIRGNLLPLVVCDTDSMPVDVAFVSKFIHKIGNHFQLLNLVVDSMRHKGSILKDLELVQETTENAIGLTQMFSSYLEQPQLSTNVNLSELVEIAVESRAIACREKRIEFAFSSDGLGADATMYGDAAFLDLALGAILDTAIDASPTGGVIRVEILAPPEILVNGIFRTIIVRVMDVRVMDMDNGSGIPADQIEKILAPFHPARPGHDGIALSLACRYIEMHGGLLQIHSCEGKGTDFEITLPIVPLRCSSILRKGST